MTGHVFRVTALALAALLPIIFGIRGAIAKRFSTGGPPPEALQRTAVSKDGTAIAYEQTGHGPLLILVSAALTDRDGDRPLAKQLASSFTVLNYDRRGRGSSGNTEPYAVESEIEDLATLATTSAGPVYLFGSSSGAVLALDAAKRLGTRVAKVFLYEPPFIVDNSRRPLSEFLLNEINTALRANDRAEAVTLFFNKGMGIPKPGVLFMRLMLPAWADMLKLAHTVPYDLTILSGTQSGKPLPRDRWFDATAPTMVAVGAKSEPFFHTGAKALVELLPTGNYKSLDGLDHSAVLMAPQAIGSAVIQFFASH
uniref:Alpha/beta hydrolase fold n=1 Tax=Solibacter usitatus (strain Ellin6076) TaxID=234267 RepID=Q025P0_SOLUE